MDDEYSIQKYGGDTARMLTKSLKALVEGLTGIAASEKKRFILSVGHIFQALLKGEFLSQLIAEWNEYREKGKIKDDYQKTGQHFECLQEILDFLDNDVPDQTRFNAMKQIFLKAACEDETDRDSVIPQQFMKLCRKLSSGEIMVLGTVYRLISSDSNFPAMVHGGLVKNAVIEKSGLKYGELVDSYRKTLIDKSLLNTDFWLTPLGNDLCRFIEDAEEI